MTKDATLSILSCVDWPLGAHVLRENEGYPCSVREVAVASVHRGNPRVSDEWWHVWSFVLLMEFYPLPFQSGQTIKRATAKRDRLTQQ